MVIHLHFVVFKVLWGHDNEKETKELKSTWLKNSNHKIHMLESLDEKNYKFKHI